eukprot:1161815-Pelagomonas_calceolata.AAC.7
MTDFICLRGALPARHMPLPCMGHERSAMRQHRLTGAMGRHAQWAKICAMRDGWNKVHSEHMLHILPLAVKDMPCMADGTQCNA